MNKLRFMLFAVILSAMTVVSCSKDDSVGIDDMIGGVKIGEAIVGTWVLTDVKMKETDSYISWVYKPTYASFNSDGTYYGSGYFGTGEGKWSMKGKIINTYIDGQLYVSYEVISVTATNAELKMTIDGSTIWIRCRKLN